MLRQLRQIRRLVPPAALLVVTCSVSAGLSNDVLLGLAADLLRRLPSVLSLDRIARPDSTQQNSFVELSRVGRCDQGVI